MGKSALCVSIAHKAAKQGKRVFYAALESSAEAIQRRILAQQADISVQELFRGTFGADKWNDISTGLGEISQLPITINAKSNLTAYQVCENADQEIDLLIVDHLQEIKGSGTSRHLDLSEAMGVLHEFAEERDIPVIVCSQLRRRYDGRPEPRLSDLKESGDIEQKADVVMLLYRPFVDDASKDMTELKVNIAKNRDGQTGGLSLLWDGPKTEVKDWSY